MDRTIIGQEHGKLYLATDAFREGAHLRSTFGLVEVGLLETG